MYFRNHYTVFDATPSTELGLDYVQIAVSTADAYVATVVSTTVTEDSNAIYDYLHDLWD